jgi:flagellar assembly factor FliW
MHSDVSHKEGATLAFSTRFGDVELREDRLLSFPQGLFGFRECTQFGLAKLPNVENSPLMLLQCVNQPSIAFLVADPAQLGIELQASDREEALAETKLAGNDTQFLTILTLYDQGDSYYLTANLKAPVLIDSNSRTGMQFILSNKSYSTQHKL